MYYTSIGVQSDAVEEGRHEMEKQPAPAAS